MREDSTEADAATLAAVARAEILLSLLSQQAAAARAEAECAELRLLLDEARVGNPQRLVHWLDVRHTPIGQPTQASDVLPLQPHLGSPGGPPQSLGCNSIGNSIESWEQLLPAARERLQRQPTGSAVAPGRVSSGKNSTRSGLTTEKRTSRPIDVEPTHRERGASTATKSSSAPFKTNASQEGGAAGCRSNQSLVKRPAGRAERLAAEQLELSPVACNQRRLGRRLRGVVASVAFHSLLVLCLAFFTLRLPSPPASLALDASPSEISTETVELSQPLEVDAPPAPVEPLAPVATAELAANLAVDSSTLSSSLLELAPARAALSPLAAGAASLSHAAAVSEMNVDATFFGASASGNCFCYVIDSSASMRDGPWEAAKGELYRSLSSLKEKQRFYIIFFNRQLSALPLPGERQPAPHALYATADNLQHARRWVDTVRIDFGAPPNDALELAISKEPDAIYLLTDGDTQVDVAGFLRRQNRVDDLIFGEQIRVPIHTIAFYSLTGQALLKQIAAENKGQFIYVPDPRQR